MDVWKARDQVDRIVLSRIRDEHGDTAISKESWISPSTGFNYGDRDVPANYLHAIEGADWLHRIAQGMASEYARKARGQGHTWAEIADAFSVDRDEVDEPAVEAFERISPPERWRDNNTHWTCTSCEQRITDRGPYSANPADNETGHGEDCERHQREISAYRRDWDLDNDPGWEYER
ncbi:hypothetical protein [Nocardia brasiliensis]|uniref:hypothetical protein n=1 Tax=Nocardia brasiliensis TaxID=37326 RepID=UPI00245852A5|nr:hypothetical protein [Nocardia brasiliensis]